MLMSAIHMVAAWIWLWLVRSKDEIEICDSGTRQHVCASEHDNESEINGISHHRRGQVLWCANIPAIDYIVIM